MHHARPRGKKNKEFNERRAYRISLKSNRTRGRTFIPKQALLVLVSLECPPYSGETLFFLFYTFFCNKLPPLDSRWHCVFGRATLFQLTRGLQFVPPRLLFFNESDYVVFDQIGMMCFRYIRCFCVRLMMLIYIFSSRVFGQFNGCNEFDIHIIFGIGLGFFAYSYMRFQ